MPHLDDGRLHAYLDGELGEGTPEREDVERHLAECPACRDELAAATRTRDRAADILAGAGPALRSPPPFEAVRERAARAGDSRERVRRLARLRSLAWAAVLVLAVGVGWYARDVTLERAASPAGRDGEVAAMRSTAPAAAAAPRSTPTVSEGQLASELTSPPPRGRGAEPDAVEERTASGLDERETASPQPVEQHVDRLRAEVAVAATEDDARDAKVGAVAARARPDVVRDGSAVADAAWVAIDEETARAALAGQLRVLPDAAVEEFALGQRDGAPAVRVRQRLPSGTEVELVEWLPTAGTGGDSTPAEPLPAALPEADRPLRSDATERVVRRGDLLIALRVRFATPTAAEVEDTLDVLAERVP